MYLAALRYREVTDHPAAEMLDSLFRSSRSPIVLLVTGGGLPKPLPLSKKCVDEVGTYFANAFDKAYLGVSFTGNPEQTIYFTLKPRPPKITKDYANIEFIVSSKAMVAVNNRFDFLIGIFLN
jgi:hypothetical protein